VWLKLLRKGRLRHLFTNGELRALDEAIDQTIPLAPRTIVIEPVIRPRFLHYIVQGSLARYIDDCFGDRRLVAVGMAGDFVDLEGFALERYDYCVGTLEHTILARIPHERLAQSISLFPQIKMALWCATSLDGAAHREWIFRLGRLRGEARIANLICEIVERAKLVDLYDGKTVPIPLLQSEFAQACGMSSVHANRCFRALRERGALCCTGSGQIDIIDEAALKRIGQFDDDFLYAEGVSTNEISNDRPVSSYRPFESTGELAGRITMRQSHRLRGVEI